MTLIDIGQLRVDEKTNEITVLPELIEQINVKDSIITIDAMGCQRDIAELLYEKEADYILAVKGNQGTLYEKTRTLFESILAEKKSVALFHNSNDEIDYGHGRIETRTCMVLPIMYLSEFEWRWKGLNSLVKLTSTRDDGQTVTTEHRYYITSLAGERANDILQYIRMHWEIENKLHWVLDVSFREDQCRIRQENAALNMAWLRKMALAMLKKETSFKASIRRKQLKACANPTYLEKIMFKI